MSKSNENHTYVNWYGVAVGVEPEAFMSMTKEWMVINPEEISAHSGYYYWGINPKSFLLLLDKL